MPTKQKRADPAPSATHVFAANLRKARTELGISQEELADRAAFHRTYVSQVERGVINASIVSMERLAKALEKPLFELLMPPGS